MKNYQWNEVSAEHFIAEIEEGLYQFRVPFYLMILGTFVIAPKYTIFLRVPRTLICHFGPFRFFRQQKTGPASWRRRTNGTIIPMARHNFFGIRLESSTCGRGRMYSLADSASFLLFTDLSAGLLEDYTLFCLQERDCWLLPLPVVVVIGVWEILVDHYTFSARTRERSYFAVWFYLRFVESRSVSIQLIGWTVVLERYYVIFGMEDRTVALLLLLWLFDKTACFVVERNWSILALHLFKLFL